MAVPTFRELIQPGSNYEFIGKQRTFLTISALLILLSIAMLPINKAVRGEMLNWTIDFKGGTEIVLTFPEKPVKAGEVRAAIRDSGHKNVDVSSFAFTDEKGKKQEAYLIRLPEFGAISREQSEKTTDALIAGLGKDVVQKVSWSGDNLFLRATQPLDQAAIGEILKAQGLEMKPWSPDQVKEFGTAVAGTSEFNAQIAIYGLDRKIQTALEGTLKTKVDVKQVDAVGPKAGEELRTNGILSLLYAIALIMLYIAFRFDFRYAPGTIASLLHDAIVVVGVFAIAWVEFSLTTVAAVLTVIGYSMNDTVVVFDRVRENESKLKDKKLDRVINISINETLSRTILTSVTTFVTTLMMNILGTGVVRNFGFAMNVGIIIGTYSSIFIAVPVMLWFDRHYFSKAATNSRRAAAPAPAEG